MKNQIIFELSQDRNTIKSQLKKLLPLGYEIKKKCNVIELHTKMHLKYNVETELLILTVIQN